MNLARGLPEGFSGLPEKRLSEAEALEDIAVFSTCQPETLSIPTPGRISDSSSAPTTQVSPCKGARQHEPNSTAPPNSPLVCPLALSHGMRSIQGYVVVK